ncbi:MAG: helix-turn-helix transcriptional regulator [Clostridia bacterium]|nr:helix-turn-helix transcriptional regulator [Clostridia bacterium]
MQNIAEKLNLVIDYIESHLSDDIDPKEIEKIACCSYYDVGRMFSLIADINISDYIRKRRLTLAGAELKNNDVKVIDVALKYGYDSPVSFARAFQAFHGFNPSVANKSEAVLNVFPRLVYQIRVKGVMDPIYKEKMIINGKEYQASCFGEADMSSWSSEYVKRKYWRLENAYDDFKYNPKTDQVLPYNNYPPINIETGQVFVIDYCRSNGSIDRKYYIADGSVWNDMSCTREYVFDYIQSIRTDKITVCGKEYEASYLGEQDMSYWSDFATKREFWRLENVKAEFDKCEKCNDVLPYNNYPFIKIENGQVFVIDYHTRGGSIDRRYYVADGTVWRDMPSTRQIIPINNEDSK